ncbi:hypothetical protein MHYP_G00072480 [Metynnis hypsauchen]
MTGSTLIINRVKVSCMEDGGGFTDDVIYAGGHFRHLDTTQEIMVVDTRLGDHDRFTPPLLCTSRAKFSPTNITPPPPILRRYDHPHHQLHPLYQ